jgi:ferrous iron transport protein B
LGLPVVTTVAIKGKGIKELTEKIIDETEIKKLPNKINYGQEIEQRIEELIEALGNVNTGYPARWTAIKHRERRCDSQARREGRPQYPHIGWFTGG